MLDSKQRIAMFLPSLRGGGAERTILKLAIGIAEKNYPVDLVLAQVEGPYLAEVPKSVRVVDLKASRIITSLPGLLRYLRRERPVAMLSALNHANIIAIWARYLAGIPIRLVVSERVALSYSFQHTSQRRGKLLPHLVKHFYPWADDIIAVSKGVADDLAQLTKLPDEKIKVIYNPVVTPELEKKVQAPLDHPWFKPDQPPVVLAAGRFKLQKDFPTLIRAFGLVRHKRDARLLILGDGPERPTLEALVRELNLEQDVSLPGFIVNPYPYMTHSDVFVLSSRWEGLPGVLIEAMYCGVPLISTDCPGGSREILKNGQYGQLVPVGNANILATAIEKALVERAARPPRESWLPFTEETGVRQYMNILLGT